MAVPTDASITLIRSLGDALMILSGKRKNPNMKMRHVNKSVNLECLVCKFAVANLESLLIAAHIILKVAG